MLVGTFETFISGFISILLAWLLHFVGIETFLNHFTGLSEHRYYLTFFVIGMVNWTFSPIANLKIINKK